MKTKILLLASSLVLAASGAFAQGNTDACHNGYAACVERCSTRPASIRESCATTCESTTNQCYSQMYGSKASAAQVIPSAAEAAAAPDEADAARDQTKAAKPAKKQR